MIVKEVKREEKEKEDDKEHKSLGL
jgi:hypothetical protein